MTDEGRGIRSGCNRLAHPPIKPERWTGWMIISETGLTDTVVWSRPSDLNALDYFLQVYSEEISSQISWGSRYIIDTNAGTDTHDVWMHHLHCKDALLAKDRTLNMHFNVIAKHVFPDFMASESSFFTCENGVTIIFMSRFMAGLNERNHIKWCVFLNLYVSSVKTRFTTFIFIYSF